MLTKTAAPQTSLDAASFTTVLQFRVVAETPNCFSIELLGKPNQPVFFRRASVQLMRSRNQNISMLFKSTHAAVWFLWFGRREGHENITCRRIQLWKLNSFTEFLNHQWCAR
jgi:hypothetical protein